MNCRTVGADCLGGARGISDGERVQILCRENTVLALEDLQTGLRVAAPDDVDLMRSSATPWRMLAPHAHLQGALALILRTG